MYQLRLPTSTGFLFVWFLLVSPMALSGVSFEQEVKFGKIVVLDNLHVYTLTIQPDGRINSSPQIAVIDNGLPGRYLLYDFPENTQLNLSISALPTGSGFSVGTPEGIFTMALFLTQYTWTTNALGEVLVEVGGSLSTSGDGKRYLNGEYFQNFQMNIDY